MPTELLGRVSGDILYVDKTGSSGFYTSVQEAIDSAEDGDTIIVKIGYYKENLMINKTINLIGEDRDNTTLDGDNNGDVIQINANLVNITGFRIIGGKSGDSSSASGISFKNVQNCSIYNNNLSDNTDGINLRDSHGNDIILNIINHDQSHGHEDGINLYQSNHNNVNDNIISSFNIGIRVQGSNLNNIQNNTVNSNHIGFFLLGANINHVHNNYISQNWDKGISLDQSGGNSLKQNTIRYSTEAIYFQDSNWNNITENNIVSGIYGLYIESSSNNSIFHNDFLGSGSYRLEGEANSNKFNDPYPSGGNYWSGNNDVDLFTGPNQDILGSDGIGDTNWRDDQYPLMTPWNIENTLPTEPLNLTATAGDFFINITWDLPTSEGNYPIRNYRIYRSNISGEETFLKEIGNLLFYNDTSVVNGVKYYYRISAINFVGEGSLSKNINATSTTFHPPNNNEEVPLFCWIAIAIIIILIIYVIVNFLHNKKRK